MKENDLTLAETSFELFLNKTNHVANAIHVHVQYICTYMYKRPVQQLHMEIQNVTFAKNTELL